MKIQMQTLYIFLLITAVTSIQLRNIDHQSTSDLNCGDKYDKIDLACYEKCQSGYKRDGVDCLQICPSGFVDGQLTCIADYDRGKGFPLLAGENLNDDKGMFSRCESVHSAGNCQKTGKIVYPKCKTGYSPNRNPKRAHICTGYSIDCIKQGFAGGQIPYCTKFKKTGKVAPSQ